MDTLSQFKVFTVFELPKIFGLSIDFTNSALYMFISIIACMIFLLGIVKTHSKDNKILSLWQFAVDRFYNFILNIIRESGGESVLQYKKLFFTMFLFIFSCNIFGLMPLPMHFTVTSHISVTFMLSLLMFILVISVAIKTKKWEFLRTFLPKGFPIFLAPMMIIVEVSSYFFRPISLAIRLTANMVAGHIILQVLAGFAIKLNIFLSLPTVLFMSIMVLFELFVAFLQAYIFIVLSSVYMGESLDTESH